jgi:hypothetical protein
MDRPLAGLASGRVAQLRILVLNRHPQMTQMTQINSRLGSPAHTQMQRSQGRPTAGRGDRIEGTEK